MRAPSLGWTFKLGFPAADISWWTLKIPWCPSRRVGTLDILQNPALTYSGTASVAQLRPPTNDATRSHALHTKKWIQSWGEFKNMVWIQVMDTAGSNEGLHAFFCCELFRRCQCADSLIRTPAVARVHQALHSGVQVTELLLIRQMSKRALDVNHMQA